MKTNHNELIRRLLPGVTDDKLRNIVRVREEARRPIGCSYGYKVVCCYDDKYTKPVKIYRGEEPIKTFMDEMLNEVQYCEKIIIKTKFKKL